MSNLQLAKRACRLYNSDMVPKAINRANQRNYIKAIQRLGDRWLLAKPVSKLNSEGMT